MKEVGKNYNGSSIALCTSTTTIIFIYPNRTWVIYRTNILKIIKVALELDNISICFLRNIQFCEMLFICIAKGLNEQQKTKNDNGFLICLLHSRFFEVLLK